MPLPTLCEGDVNPVNSKVWGVAKAETVISELNVLATDGEVILMVFVVLELETDSLVLLARAAVVVLSKFNSFATSPNAEISRVLLSIFSLTISFWGAVSASTIPSTICVIFSPEPPWLIALK